MAYLAVVLAEARIHLKLDKRYSRKDAETQRSEGKMSTSGREF
jgi:hypothetical protein